MARTPSSFTKLLRRPSPKIIQNPSKQSRDIRNDGCSNDSHGKPPQHSSEIVKKICRTIRSKPRWENTLSSDFPGVNFLDSTFLNQVLLHQKNVFLSIRLLYWLSSTFGYSPSQSTCGLIFNALVEDNAAKAAKSFLHFTQYIPEPSVLKSYIRCLCESRMLEDALQVFDEMKKTGISPSLETWNSLLLASIKEEYTDLVWELYGEMIDSSVVPDLDTVSYLIQAFCLDKNVSKGYELLRQVLNDGYVPHKISFDKLLFEFILDHKYDKVSALLHIMIEKGIHPDLFTYQQIIHALCLKRKQREGLHIFNNLKNRGYDPDKIMYTTMIHGLCKMKWIWGAKKLLFEMIQKGIEPNHYTYNTLLYGYLKIGHIKSAQNLYTKMHGRGYRETLIANNTMINGLCSHGMTMEAFQLFKQDFPKDVVTYNSMIRGFCKEGKLAEGLNLLVELVNRGLQPSCASYGPVIQKVYELGQIGKIKTFEKLIAVLSQNEKLDVCLVVLGYMFKIGYTPSYSLVKVL